MSVRGEATGGGLRDSACDAGCNHTPEEVAEIKCDNIIISLSKRIYVLRYFSGPAWIRGMDGQFCVGGGRVRARVCVRARA